MSSNSLWSEFKCPQYPQLAADARYDVVIVGGGVCGLTAALLLQQAGKRVCVLEKERIGGGETSHTSAHLTYVTDLRLRELVDRFNTETGRLAWDAGARAIDFIESTASSNAIDCDFRRVPGFLYSSPNTTHDELAELRREARCANDLGFAAEFLELGPVAAQPAVRFENQAVFHPLKYIAGVAQVFVKVGGAIYEKSEATAFSDSPPTVTANGHTVVCEDIVIATHVPLVGMSNMAKAMLFQTKLFPYSSYVLHATVPPDSIEPGLYTDTGNPYYYLRIHDEGNERHAVFGGQDHKTGTVVDTDERMLKLEAYFLGLFPSANITHRWSGQVIETADGLPYIGSVAEHQFMGTGFSGNGLTFGTAAAMLMCDLITDRDSHLDEVFSPSRATALRGLAHIVSENAAFPLHVIADRLKPHGSDVADVMRGEGRVLTLDGKRVAVHRRDDDSLIAVSAICTHLGCEVRWNQSAESWDCPCHGSRFLPDGAVIGGPAETALARINV